MTASAQDQYHCTGASRTAPSPPAQIAALDMHGSWVPGRVRGCGQKSLGSLAWSMPCLLRWCVSRGSCVRFKKRCQMPNESDWGCHGIEFILFISLCARQVFIVVMTGQTNCPWPHSATYWLGTGHKKAFCKHDAVCCKIICTGGLVG